MASTEYWTVGVGTPPCCSEGARWCGVAQFAFQLPVKENVRNYKIMLQLEKSFDQRSSFQIYQNRRIRNEDCQKLHRHLIQSTIQFSNRDVQKFCCSRIADNAFR